MRSLDLCVSLAAAMVLACGDDLGEREPPPAQGRPASYGEFDPVGNEARGLSIEDLAGVMLASSEVSLARNVLARDRARDDLVRNFADRSIALQPHDLAIFNAALLRLGISPQSSIASDQIRQRAAELLTQLQLQGVDFDRAFLEAQIAAQREVIQLFDDSAACTGVTATVPVRTISCTGFGGTQFGTGSSSPPVQLGFDANSFFTALRSSLLAQLTDTTVLAEMIATGGTTP
jgi:predicted outer membrane protein